MFIITNEQKKKNIHKKQSKKDNFLEHIQEIKKKAQKNMQLIEKDNCLLFKRLRKHTHYYSLTKEIRWTIFV